MNSLATEQAVLGFCLTDPDALSKVCMAGVGPETFACDDHRKVFQTMLALEQEGTRVTLANLSARLPQMGDVLWQAHEAAPLSLDLAPFLSELLRSAWHWRASETVRALGDRLARRQPYEDNSPYEAAVAAALDQLTRNSAAEKGPKLVADLFPGFDKDLARSIADRQSKKPSGITTGIRVLDLITGGGLGEGWITTVAARTGKGKTTLAINLLHAAASAGYACAYFTVEMLTKEILLKLLSHASQVSGTKLRVGDMAEADFDKLAAAQQSLYPRRIWIDDTTRANFEAVEHACHRLSRQGHLDLIVVDYIQQFTLPGRHSSTVERLTQVSHRLKQLANELKIAVVSVAQLNREAEKGDGKPDVFHIKDAGAIEQDSDLILLIHTDGPDDVKIFVGKNRHGRERFAFPIGTDLAKSTFRNLNINLEAFK